MLFWCHKKIFHCNSFLFWMNSFKNSSQIFWVQCYWQLFTERWEFELSQSVHSFLKQHFAWSCIYYSVIPTKIFSSVFALKFLKSSHFNLNFESEYLKTKYSKVCGKLSFSKKYWLNNNNWNKAIWRSVNKAFTVIFMLENLTY